MLMESRQTTRRPRAQQLLRHGAARARSSRGRCSGLDAVSNGPLAFPQGSAVYLYGSSLLKYIEDRYGPDKIREISHRYASRLIPGGLSRVSREALGRGYDELWRGLERIAGAAATRCEVEEADAPRADADDAPHFRRARAARRGPEPALLPRRARLRLPEGDERRITRPTCCSTRCTRHDARAHGGLQRRRRGAHARRAARWSSSAPTSSRCATAHLGRVGRQLGRSVPASTSQSGEVRELTRSHRVPTSPTSRPTARRSPAPWARTGRRDLALVPIDRRRAASVLARRAARARLRTVVVARRAPHRLLALEAGRLPRHPRLRPRDGARPRALGRPRDGHRPALVSPDGRFVRLRLRPQRHLQPLRLRARDPDDPTAHEPRQSGAYQPCDLPRRQAAWSSPGSPRWRLRRSSRRAFDPATLAAGRSRSPTRGPTRQPVTAGERSRARRAAPTRRWSRRSPSTTPGATSTRATWQLTVLVGPARGWAPASGPADRARRPGVQPFASALQCCWCRPAATRRCRLDYFYNRLWPQLVLSGTRTAVRAGRPGHRRHPHPRYPPSTS